MPYNLLVFDADNTLFDYNKAEARAFRRTCDAAGFDYDDSLRTTYRRVNDAIWGEFERNEISSENLKTERFRRFFQETAYSGKWTPEQMSAAYLTNLGQGADLLPGAETLIRQLGQNYKLALLTNGLKEVQENRLKLSPLRNRFGSVVISDAVGCKKPEPEIFAIVMQHCGNPPKEQVLMIGDSLSSDIRGGINFGIDTCWYNPEGKPNHTDLCPTYEIHNLTELPALL